MKNLKSSTLTLLLLFFIAFPSLAKDKGAEVRRLSVSADLVVDGKNYGEITGEGTLVINPGSIFLKTFKFKLPEAILNDINFGYYANKIIGIYIIDDRGELLMGAGFLNKAGYLTVTVHKNGSGTFAPQGWLISFGLPIP